MPNRWSKRAEGGDYEYPKVRDRTLGRVFSLSFHAERRDIYMYGGDEKDRNRSFYLKKKTGNQSKKIKPETRTRNFRKKRRNKVMIA